MARRTHVAEQMPLVLVLGVAVYLVTAATLHVTWILTADDAWILAFRSVNGLFLMAYAAIGVVQTVGALRLFRARDPLRVVWMLLVVASIVRLAGHVLTNGIAPVPQASDGLAALGRVIAGPGYMALLAFALAGVVRLYRRLGLMAWLTRLDLALIAAVCLFALQFIFDLFRWRAHGLVPATLLQAMAWTSDPLLAVLLLEAIVIRRAAVQMGAGYLSLLLDAFLIRRDAALFGGVHVSRCWGAYAAGIFLTTLGDAGIWAQTHGYLHWPWTSLLWYVWPLAETAFAIAPGWQILACHAARRCEASPLGSPIVRPAYQR